MKIITLDLSKRSTGWAVWHPGWERPRYGHWELGSGYTSPGRVFCKLHECLIDVRGVLGFEAIYYEQKLNPASLQGHTTLDTISLLGGLEAHVQSFAAAMGMRCRAINVQTWRGEFIGRQEVSAARKRARAKAKASGKKVSARDDLKALTRERCQQLGFAPRNDDEADAIGLLDYQLGLEGIVPAWRANETLRAPLGIAS